MAANGIRLVLFLCRNTPYSFEYQFKEFSLIKFQTNPIDMRVASVFPSKA